MDAEGGGQSSVGCVAEVASQFEICRAFGVAPLLPAVGTSPAPASYEELRSDLIFLDDAVALRLMGAYAKYSPLV